MTPPIIKQGNYFFNLRLLAAPLLIIFITALIATTQTTTGYAECTDTRIPCKNPYLQSEIGYCSAKDKTLCEKEYLEPGTSIGEKPGWAVNNLFAIIAGTTITSFLINHLLHNKHGTRRREHHQRLPHQKNNSQHRKRKNTPRNL